MSVFAGNSQEGVKNQGVPFLLLLPFFISFVAVSGNKPSDRGAAPAATVADGKQGWRAGLCSGGEFCSGRKQGEMCSLPSAFR